VRLDIDEDSPISPRRGGRSSGTADEEKLDSLGPDETRLTRVKRGYGLHS
jgi:hypothetical protein